MITNQGDATDVTRRGDDFVLRGEAPRNRRSNSTEAWCASVTLSLCQQNGPEMKGLASGMGIENRN